MITASCRSLEGFSIIEALENCADLFTRFGGHSLAAGFTIPEERIPELATRLQKLARPAALEFGDLPDLDVDAVVGLSDLNQGFFRELEKLEPCGEGNPAPVLIARSLTPLNIKRIGRNRDHLKLVFSDGSQELPAIGFGWGSAAQDLPTSVDAAFHFTENEYRGVRSFQAQILDLMPANQQNGI